jgi:hypothetical protein
MAIITPTYAPNIINFRIPDNDINPRISQKDYFYSATNKNFLIKQLGGTLTSVQFDFYNLDCAFFINNNFTTP